MKFNPNFYQSNMKYTREDAERVMRENGYTSFHFKGCSYSNGASFYFDVEGLDKEVRVSDHPLTGRRAFDVIELSFVKRGVGLPKVNKKKETSGVSPFMKRVYDAMLKKGHLTIEEYNKKINA